MKVLVVGNGGRESALAWGLSKSRLVSEVVCAPGNPGMAEFGECRPVPVDDLEGIADLARRINVALVVVGPEAPLSAGLVDLLTERGIRVFGPSSAGAQLESSKSFAKQLMRRHGIPTASSEEFDRADEALEFVSKREGPLVVKADGLAQGKGVTVCEDATAAKKAIVEAMEARRFGDSGKRVLVEECLEGEELSLLMMFDGSRGLPLEPAQDYKRIFDGDQGPNTGGIGSYSPVPACTREVYERILDEILDPVADALKKEGIPYLGIIYAGLMLTSTGPKVIEFNCRFGDPETQALMPRLVSDFGEAVLACVEGDLQSVQLEWSRQACVSVVAASAGYPGDFAKGFPIEGLKEAEALMPRLKSDLAELLLACV
ncbi:MAG: phosphoribosylamine--glycine ligase, partial [Actinomycetota bacterium]